MQMFISNNHVASRRCVVLFAGWGMDSRPFDGLAAEGYDIVVVWDYTDMSNGADIARACLGYDEVCVVAWSFGVPAAARFLLSDEGRGLPVTLTVAVNGTPWPVDDCLGIPRAIFSGTLAGLSGATLLKFYRRMAGDSKRFEAFMERAPQRDIASLRVELEAIDRAGAMAGARWDVVYVAGDDRIIPSANQLRAWQGHPDVRIIPHGAHLIPFERVMRECLVDKSLVSRRFGRSAATYADAAAVQQGMSRRLASLWAATAAVDGAEVLEIGYGTGIFTRAYLEHGTPSGLTLWDIVDHCDFLPSCGGARVDVAVCDAEVAVKGVAEDRYDAIVAASTVQWFNSLGSFMHDAARALRPDGLLVMSTFGPLTFGSIRAITGFSLRHLGIDDLKALAPRSLVPVVAEQEVVEMKFDTVMEMLRHMRLTGVNGTTHGGVKMVHDISARYPRNDSDGSVTLVYQPQYLIFRKAEDVATDN